jgi:RNA recognition motif-containing protein
MATKLFVGNLAFHTTPADLEALFRQAGVVASVAIISDKFRGARPLAREPGVQRVVW